LHGVIVIVIGLSLKDKLNAIASALQGHNSLYRATKLVSE